MQNLTMFLKFHKFKENGDSCLPLLNIIGELLCLTLPALFVLAISIPAQPQAYLIFPYLHFHTPLWRTVTIFYQMQYHNLTTYRVSQKSSPCGFLALPTFPKRLEIFPPNFTCLLYRTFLSTLEYEFLFNYYFARPRQRLRGVLDSACLYVCHGCNNVAFVRTNHAQVFRVMTLPCSKLGQGVRANCTRPITRQ